jgi:hypothetical protein
MKDDPIEQNETGIYVTKYGEKVEKGERNEQMRL